MNTIQQRLRDIAFRLRKPRDGRPWDADDGGADLLDAIAAELESPAAAGAVPVVATEYVCKRPGKVSVYASVDDTGQEHRDEKWSTVDTYPLVRQADHQAMVADLTTTVSTLQARINALEARWNLCSACNAEAGGAADMYVKMFGDPQQDTSKEQP